MSSPPTLPPIPLYHDGATWSIEVTCPRDNHARLVRLIRSTPHENSIENYWDLPEATRQAICRQVQRRFQGINFTP